MLKVGYRIRLSSGKGPDREGVVMAVMGSMLRVRWPSEEETTVIPAPGTLTVLSSSDDQAAPAVPPARPAAKKPAAKKPPAKKPPAKKPAAKKPTAQKAAASADAKKETTPKKGASKRSTGAKRSSR